MTRMEREEVRNRFPVGTVVMATIYNIWEPQLAVVHSWVSEREVRKGNQFGIRVLYKNEVYWVAPKDVQLID